MVGGVETPRCETDREDKRAMQIGTGNATVC